MTTQRTAPQRYWQNWDKGEAAKRIDKYWRESESGWREILVADILLEFGQRTRMLEIGCGSGLIYQEMVRNHVVSSSSYVGGDASRRMLEIARQRFTETQFLELDIFSLHFPDKSQPNVACIHVLQHLPDYAQAMRELMRIAGEKLYVVSWFSPEEEDQLVFSEASARWDGQAFQNNCYSLPKFLAYIWAIADRPIHDLRIHHFGDHNYSISITFVQKHASSSDILTGLFAGFKECLNIFEKKLRKT